MSDWAREYFGLQDRVLAFIAGDGSSFSDLALGIYRFQFRQNAAYQRFCKMRGCKEDISDWEKIPAVPQQAFKLTSLTTFPIREAVREFRTSGTTGEGYGSHYLADLTLYNSAICAGWKRLELPALPMLALANSPEEAPHSSLSYMLGRLAGSNEKFFYLQNGCLDEGRLRSDLASIETPVILMGTALAFLNMMENAKSSLPLAAGSLVFETGGYKGSGRTLLKEVFYDQLCDFFAVETAAIINEYGMTELSSQFYSRGLGQVHLAGPWLRHRVIQPLTGDEVDIGETGVLQLFDLANLGSVLAIQTEDLAVRSTEGFILLGRDRAAIERGCSRSVDELLNQ